MKDRLLNKLRQIRENPNSKEFIIADAKDGDMAMGVPTPGQPYPPIDAERFRSMTEYHEVFPAGALNYKVPASMPWHHATLIEPLACSLHAVERGEIQYQDTVVIAGCGPLGLGMVASAKMKGRGGSSPWI